MTLAPAACQGHNSTCGTTQAPTPQSPSSVDSPRVTSDPTPASQAHPPERPCADKAVSDLTASVVVAEIGVDMSRVPTSGRLVSWPGLCPRSDESAGKRRSNRVRKSGTWIKTTLVTAAWAAVRVKTSYLRAQFLRIKARRGAKKAILAIAASMLTAAFHMLRDGTEYNDLGSDVPELAHAA